ncbi:MAG: protein kinase, partial [Acidobacteriaceae bacterium]|nr:protein kinase [Acidobacteriaceae bacterium]
MIVLLRLRLVCAALIIASRAFSQQYPFLLVPNSPVAVGPAMLQDHLGRLWLSAGGGVNCFDGTRFFSLRDLHVPHPPSTANAFAEDTDGGIWFSSPTGLYRFYAGHLSLIFDGFARGVVSLGAGLIVAGVGPAGPVQPALLHLYRFRKTQAVWKLQQLADWVARGSGTLKLDHEGKILYPCLDAWCELSSKVIADWHPGSAGAPVRHGDIYPGIESILRDRFGCVWFRSTASAKYQCPGDPAPKQLPPEIASNGISIYEAHDGSIVIPSNQGTAIGRPGSFRVVTPQNGYSTLMSFTLLTEDGSMWFATPKGLYRFAQPFRLEFWTEGEGLSYPFAITRVGSQMFVCSGFGISALSSSRSRWVQLKPSRELGVVRSLMPGPGKTLLAVPHHDGVAQLALDGTVIARSPPGQDPEAMQLARGNDGQVWLAGSGVGRIVWSGKAPNIIPEQLPGPRVLGADIKFESNTGKLWVCYGGGLAVKEDGHWRRITTAEGLLENPCRSLAALPNGDVWIGYFTAAAFALVHEDARNKVTVRQYNDRERAAQVRFLDADHRGWLWRGTTNAVYVADPWQARDGNWIELNQTDGLRETEAEQQAFFNDSDGSVWFAADNTLVHFAPPQDFVHPSFAPKIFISGYSWNGGTPKIADIVQAIPHSSNLVAHIGSLQFDRRNALRIRYRFLPDQQTWRESRNLDVPLGTPAWGAHTLEVQGRLFTGSWSTTQRHSFTVLKPLWLAWPALLAFGLTGFSAVAGGYQWRKKLMKRARKRFPDLTEWRLTALSPEAHELVGTVLDSRYEVGPVLARGGFASVLKGRDLQQNGQPCAIKVFRQELTDKDWMARRFHQEVSALEQIRHPNVVSIYGHGKTPAGSSYLVMDFIEGKTLREVLSTGPLPSLQIARYLRQAGSALDQIHARGICHRDLKPENLMIRSPGPTARDLVLIDFSIAIVKDPDETIHGLSRAAGTIYYMAPEQAIGYADASTDIHSLAKVAIEMITGSRLSLLLPDASMDLPVRVRELLAALPLRLSAASIELIGSALEFDPARRPGIAGR